MDTERLEKLRFKHKSQVNRMTGFVKHQEHTAHRRSRIAQIVGCDVEQVEELLSCIKKELEYVKKEGE